jgi:hypothetical protein
MSRHNDDEEEFDHENHSETAIQPVSKKAKKGSSADKPF